MPFDYPERLPVGFTRGTIQIVSDGYRWDGTGIHYDTECTVCGHKVRRPHRNLIKTETVRCKGCQKLAWKDQVNDFKFIGNEGYDRLWQCPKCLNISKSGQKNRVRECVHCAARWREPKVGDKIGCATVKRIRERTLDMACGCGNIFAVRRTHRLMLRPCPVCLGKFIFIQTYDRITETMVGDLPEGRKRIRTIPVGFQLGNPYGSDDEQGGVREVVE